MRTIRLQLDQRLLGGIGLAARELGISRSAFARGALREALRRRSARRLEWRHREGYTQRPVTPDEFSCWAAEQAWPLRRRGGD